MTEMTRYEPGQFSWVDLMAPDTEEATRFYTSLFGWDFVQSETGDPDSGPYTQFMLRDAPVCGMGEMSNEMRQAGVPPLWNSYVSVEDADATLARVQELGGGVTMPTMQVMTVGRMAIFTDPQGAAFSIWQPQDHLGAGIVNEPGSLSWNELFTTDIPGARRFYGDLFGWTFEESGDPDAAYTEIKLGDRSNGGILPAIPEMQGIPPNWGVYFAVEDCEKSVARVVDLGGQVVRPPISIEPGTFAVCADSRGGMFNVIALSNPD